MRININRKITAIYEIIIVFICYTYISFKIKTNFTSTYTSIPFPIGNNTLSFLNRIFNKIIDFLSFSHTDNMRIYSAKLDYGKTEPSMPRLASQFFAVTIANAKCSGMQEIVVKLKDYLIMIQQLLD